MRQAHCDTLITDEGLGLGWEKLFSLFFLLSMGFSCAIWAFVAEFVLKKIGAGSQKKKPTGRAARTLRKRMSESDMEINNLLEQITLITRVDILSRIEAPKFS